MNSITENQKISSRRSDFGYEDNKDIIINSIQQLKIHNFRTFHDQEIKLGRNMTLIVGRNGTMKTSLLGLIAHPFGSEAVDAFGNALKTKISEVFRLSLKYDTEKYNYDMVIKTNKNEVITEPVYIDDRGERHRVVVSGHEKGDGNFSYNTSFLSMKRVLPITSTNAQPQKDALLTEEEAAQQKDFYEFIFPSTEYSEFESVQEVGIKTTYGPTGEKAIYDFNTISSGEDNIGAIFSRLVGFQRNKNQNENAGSGILCIDEMETSLHPVAQIRLFKYLYKWSRDNHVQIVMTTHSLHVIQYLYLEEEKNLENNNIIINFVSCSKAGNDKNYPILCNPDYNLAYKELTFKNPIDVSLSHKIDVICEDEQAINFIKKIIKKRDILNLVNFRANLNNDEKNKGTTYMLLTKLCTNFCSLLENAFVIFDADVPETALCKIKNKEYYIKLPDTNNFAIERRIIYYIISLDNDDQFFKKFDKEKAIFLTEFKDAGIKSLTLSNIANESECKIELCKNWVEHAGKDFNKYLTYYCSKSLDSGNFVQNFINRINIIRSRRGLPRIIG